jgi:hypothetical protein
MEAIAAIARKGPLDDQLINNGPILVRSEGQQRLAVSGASIPTYIAAVAQISALEAVVMLPGLSASALTLPGVTRLWRREGVRYVTQCRTRNPRS